MNITDIKVKTLQIPFKYSFKHASAERSTTQSIWIEVITENGIRGFGESCPREYVTRESIASTTTFVDAIASELRTIQWSLEKIEYWIHQNRRRIDQQPAAWCAIELAILDALAKTNKQSIEALIGAPEIHGSFCYSAILGDSPTDIFKLWLGRYQLLNMHDFKLKLSGDQHKDNKHINMIMNSMNSNCAIRVDANNMFNSSSEVIDYCKPFSDAIFAIEEPLAAKRFQELRQIAQQLNVRIVLDESFTQIDDFSNLCFGISPWIINIRISKLGGILRSLECINMARQQQTPIIIGAHVGETSLLTRAAICVANRSRDVLLAQEGGFGTYFIQQDICEPSLRFGNNGCINSDAVQHMPYGLGVL